MAGRRDETAAVALRVRCALDVPGPLIDNVWFGRIVDADGAQVLVSEVVTTEQAEQFCRIEGFALWQGDAERVRAVDDAIQAARAAAAAAPVRRVVMEGTVAEQLEEQRRINARVTEELRQERERAERLADENRRLREENERYKAAGYVAPQAQ